MTGFRPSDWDDDTALTVRFGEPHGFGFERLLRSEHLIEFSGVVLISIAEPELLTILAGFVLEYSLTGRIRGLVGPNGDAMVEYAASRFENQVAVTDEPLTIFGLVTFFEQEKPTLATCLTHALDTLNAPSWGIPFEAFAAYLLAGAFSAPILHSNV